MRNGSSSGIKENIFSCNKCILIPGQYQKEKQILNEIGKDKMLEIYLEVGEAEKRHSYL